ncbi:MAG: hypothetical protein KGM46_02705 [Pseudomonadota bacterium]|nr:hypothetical protein [Xanthomonadaceae bacterium]MDE2247775.1 hypothetical protein [Xanthomonadaceae bacterium]MDE3209632.1 hypothetical protein [Pseudomonadota bacterium]
MQYDQSWMGNGIIGGLQAGLVSLLAALLLFLYFHWLGRRHRWSYGRQIGWTFLLACVLTVSGDLWNLFYFNYAQLQSLELLKAKLALVHDPEHLGLRVLCELLGVALGIYLGWASCNASWRRRFGARHRAD